jgi:RNA polymerase sigma-70 factor (ECF subfamily)
MEIASTTLNPLLLALPEKAKPTSPAPNANSSDVRRLAAGAASGSIEDFEQLVHAYEARIYGFLRRHLGNAHDAQDITQETFVRAWRGIHRFDPARDFTIWIFVIARRAAANHFRARRPHEKLPDDLAADAHAPGAADEAAALWSAAKKLKPAHYEALWLRYAEDFSVAETARVMGLTTIHVKVILHRARKELARYLQRKQL